MLLVVIALFVGFACGVIFSLLKLPVPAPGTLAGVAGVVGIFLGAVFVNHIR
jgi:XapX domain-containing protein